MKNVIAILVVSLSLLACTPDKNITDDFYWAFQNYRDGKVSQKDLFDVYSEYSNYFSDTFFNERVAVDINTLCIMYQDYSDDKFVLNTAERLLIESDIKTLERFLSKIENAGSIYRRCQKLFDLTLQPDWRYEN